ncbi:protein-glutamine gamma-glutamyltransferase E-like [Rhinoraja longicauda]
MEVDPKPAPIGGKCQVDFQYEANNKAHKTIEISNKRLIVRRGQTFDIKVTFKDGCNPQEARLKLKMETGPKPTRSKGTSLVIPFTQELNLKRWSVIVSSATKNELCLTISTSPKAVIGRCSLSLVYDYEDKLPYLLGNLVILFNPWCAEDEVFLDSEAKRQEYVMNENGTIYYGGSDYICDRDWNFGQFEEDILDICLALLDKAPKYIKNPHKQHGRRGYPVYIARTVSALVNSANDQGVLRGNWSGSYHGGKNPGSWSGSVAILRQWKLNNFEAVCYGQCWVFAAVACTVLRTLGIPTRVVTNFDSAHDADANLTIDNYYNVDGDNIGGSSDSIWNFHVWNECWMARGDLDPGYHGWQVVDATPQEESEDTYRCGPASLTAIKQGDMGFKYDVPFVFAEVNANCVNWLLFADGTKLQVDVDVSRVGHYVSTKKCGKDEREDITDLYKYSDGSTEEEEIFKKADMIIKSPAEKKTLQVHLKVSRPVYVGRTVAVSVVICNTSKEDKACTVKVWAKKRMYHGTILNEIIKKFKKDITIPANGDQTIPWEVSPKEYGQFPDMYNLMRLIAYVTEKSPENNVAKIQDFSLLHPRLTVKMQNFNAYVNEKVHVEISFQNPFAQTLKDCFITLEGNGLIKDQTKIGLDNVAPNAHAKVTADFTPMKKGKKKLLVDFDCNLMQNVKGSLNIEVQSKK